MSVPGTCVISAALTYLSQLSNPSAIKLEQLSGRMSQPHLQYKLKEEHNEVFISHSEVSYRLLCVSLAELQVQWCPEYKSQLSNVFILGWCISILVRGNFPQRQAKLKVSQDHGNSPVANSQPKEWVMGTRGYFPSPSKVKIEKLEREVEMMLI